MNPDLILKLGYSAFIIIAVNLLFALLKYSARKTQKKLGIRKSRYFATRRLLSIASLFIICLLLILVWDVNIKNVWVSVTSILAMVAIAFFAVWSLVGNILAGVILYFTSPFKIDDSIEVLPDGIRGKVLTINTFYAVLQDDEGNYINIPNSLFFQKYIRVIRGKHVGTNSVSK